LYALRSSIPSLTRSACIACFSAMTSADCRRWKAISRQNKFF
jgi:hypothetical protein